MRNTFAAIKLALLLSLGSLPAFSTVPLYATDLVEPLGDLKTLSGWSGLEPGATLEVPGEAAFVYPNGPRGQFKHGFRVLNDSAAEWQNFYGVQFEVNLPDTREVELTATIERAARGNSRTDSGHAALWHARLGARALRPHGFAFAHALWPKFLESRIRLLGLRAVHV
jgi:hypothetical protein